MFPLIAVVDDDASIRMALQRLLTSYGVDVRTFASGQEFIASVATHRPDCLILDMDMPGMTGADVQQALAESGTRMPIIIITGHDAPHTEARCRAAGAAAYLRKPIEETALLDTIAGCVGSRPLGRR